MLMSKEKFRLLKDAKVELAWKIFGREIVNRFAGETAVPIPFFVYSKSPCAPGFVILSKQISFGSLIKRKPPERIFSEYLWDFYPRWATTQCNNSLKIMKTKTEVQDEENVFVYETSRTENDHTKTVRVVIKGKSISKLNVKLKDLIDTVVDTELFEDTFFNNKSFYLVDKVFTVDEMRVEVLIDEDMDFIRIDSRYPIAFTVCHILIRSNEYFHYIRKVKKINAAKFRARWLNRDHYKLFLHNFIPNQRKYGGESGDVLGPQNRPFFLTDS